MAQLSDDEHQFWLREARRIRANEMNDMMEAVNIVHMDKRDKKSVAAEILKWRRFEDREVDDGVSQVEKTRSAMGALRGMLGGKRKR